MTDALLLVLAGIGGGLAGSIAGLASAVSYPALLAAGLGPVQANVTNTVALVFSSLGSTVGAAPELRGQLPTVRRLGVAAVAGGATGAGLLLITDPDTFEKLAPCLIAGASVAILARPRPRHAGAAGDEHPGTLVAGVFAVGIYGGYFGAAAGVVLLALLLASINETIARASALRNAILGIANGTAAIAFALLADVDWSSMAPLAIGLLAGARTGPVIVRRSDASVLRTLIGIAGLAVALKLAVDAY